MQAEFQRGDGKGHTNWIDGNMIAVIPPEYQFYLGKLDDLKYTEKGAEEIRKGYIGHLCGWEILVSNNIASPESNVFYPLFCHYNCKSKEKSWNSWQIQRKILLLHYERAHPLD